MKTIWWSVHGVYICISNNHFIYYSSICNFWGRGYVHWMYIVLTMYIVVYTVYFSKQLMRMYIPCTYVHRMYIVVFEVVIWQFSKQCHNPKMLFPSCYADSGNRTRFWGLGSQANYFYWREWKKTSELQIKKVKLDTRKIRAKKF